MFEAIIKQKFDTTSIWILYMHAQLTSRIGSNVLQDWATGNNSSLQSSLDGWKFGQHLLSSSFKNLVAPYLFNGSLEISFGFLGILTE